MAPDTGRLSRSGKVAHAALGGRGNRNKTAITERNGTRTVLFRTGTEPHEKANDFR